MVTGKCGICDWYTYQDETGKGCKSDDCTFTQILKTNGKCEDCSPYKHHDESGR